MLTLAVICIITAAVVCVVVYVIHTVKPRRVKITAGFWKVANVSLEADADGPKELSPVPEKPLFSGWSDSTATASLGRWCSRHRADCSGSSRSRTTVLTRTWSRSTVLSGQAASCWPCRARPAPRSSGRRCRTAGGSGTPDEGKLLEEHRQEPGHTAKWLWRTLRTADPYPRRAP
jgi:hypothetical protein